LGRVTYCCSWSYGITKPVIATKINGNKDTVVHKETFLYQELTELSLYFKILEDSKVRAQFWQQRQQDVKIYLIQQLILLHFNVTFAATKDFQK
jgi:hypothetical protein